MHDVFISYSNRDKPIADALCARFEAGNIRCWMAPRDILPGSSWGASIIQAISGSRLMVLIFSGASNTSPQVLREVERAVSKGISILPFRIEDAELSESMEYFISTPHWLDAMSPPLEEHLGRAAATAALLLQAMPTRQSSDTSAAAPKRSITVATSGPESASALPQSSLNDAGPTEEHEPRFSDREGRGIQSAQPSDSAMPSGTEVVTNGREREPASRNRSEDESTPGSARQPARLAAPVPGIETRSVEGAEGSAPDRADVLWNGASAARHESAMNAQPLATSPSATLDPAHPVRIGWGDARVRSRAAMLVIASLVALIALWSFRGLIPSRDRAGGTPGVGSAAPNDRRVAASAADSAPRENASQGSAVDELPAIAPPVSAERITHFGADPEYKSGAEVTLKGIVTFYQTEQPECYHWRCSVLIMKDGIGEIQVFVGSRSLLDQSGVSLKVGDAVRITGSRVRFSESEAIIAREIVVGSKRVELLAPDGSELPRVE
jgi:hypothetical protein